MALLKYRRRAPANDEEPFRVTMENTESLPYWDSQAAVYQEPAGDEVCEIPGENNHLNSKWVKLAVGFVGGLVFSKLVR